MVDRTRLSARVIVVILIVGLIGASCKTPDTQGGLSPSDVKPSRILAAPAGLVGMTQVGTNGSMWVLAGTGAIKTITQLNVASGAILRTVGVNSSATDIVQSPTGVVVVGIGSSTAGAVSLYDGGSGSVIATIPVSAPVIRLALSNDGTTVYALEGASAVRSVVAVGIQQRAIIQSGIPLEKSAVAVQPLSDGSGLWVLLSDGTVEEVSLASGQVMTSFGTGGPCQALAISPNGRSLYILRAVKIPSTVPGVAPNVAVVSIATESDVRALPAPDNAVDIAIAPDGRTIYMGVGTPTVGNVQAFALTG
jgi:hypothetical protein